MTERVCVGQIVAAHGVQGAVRIKSFTEVATDIGRFGPVEDEAGKSRFGLKVSGEVKGLLIVKLKGVDDRNAAEALRGTKLYVARERLPKPGEDEFFYSDLIGLRVEAVDGAGLGTVKAVFDFGAGELVEIALSAGGSLMVPFTKAMVPAVDVAGGKLVVDPPVFVGTEEDEEAGGREG
jgi:16S rRNA processing protein RimM